MILCRNCHHPAEGNFCSNCGQKTLVERLTVSGLLKDLPKAVFHVDRGFFFNVFRMFRQPGKTIDAFLKGIRKPFFHPASYLIIALLLNYLVVKIYNMHFYDDKELTGMDEFSAKAIREYDAMQWWFLEHTYIYFVFAILAASFFLYLVFRLTRQDYNLAESSVAVLFITAQSVMIQTIIYLCFGWIKSGVLLRSIESLNTLILVVYVSIAGYQLLKGIKNNYAHVLLSMFIGVGITAIGIAVGFGLYGLLA